MTYLPPLEPFVLLENSRDADGSGYLYERPARIIRCDEPAEIDAAFEAVEQGLSDGLFAAGWISYEVGYWIEPKLRALMPPRRPEPLLWIGLFPRRQRLDRHDLETFWRDRTACRAFDFSTPVLSLDRPAYERAVSRVHDYLAAGDVYQVNLTMDATGVVGGDPLCLHAVLRRAQPVAYGAFIATGDWCVSSHSPELFFARSGDAMMVKPMKGTAPRGRTDPEDRAAADHLRRDPKSQAENLMIVDLERNDLSRLAEPGSVLTDALFEVEALPTALQMTSTIRARLRDPQSLRRLVDAIFPCGSVTGAPKIRAMQIIAELERRPRGVYTGAIGHIAPGGDGQFNVPIRTLAVDRAGRYRFGVGSGIVADSDAGLEYDECRLKAAFLEKGGERPSLIETILFEPDKGYWLLDDHLQRLASSAHYFGYPVRLDEVAALLDAHAAALDITSAHRVRLLVGSMGALSVTSGRFAREADLARPTIAWAPRPVRSDDVFLYHKTTHRPLYARAAAARGRHWDLVFVNERGEVTEGARSNIFIERDGILVTPPTESGLLAGVLRDHILRDPDRRTSIETIDRDDVRAAQCVYMGNALYGLVRVDFVDEAVQV